MRIKNEIIMNSAVKSLEVVLDMRITDERVMNNVVKPLKNAHKLNELIVKLLFFYTYDKEFRESVDDLDIQNFKAIRDIRKMRSFLQQQGNYADAGYESLKEINKAIESDAIYDFEDTEVFVDLLNASVKPYFSDRLCERLYILIKYLRILQEMPVFCGANEKRYKNYTDCNGVVPLDSFLKLQLGIETNQTHIKNYDKDCAENPLNLQEYRIFKSQKRIRLNKEFVYTELSRSGIILPSAGKINLSDFISARGSFSPKNLLNMPVDIDWLDEDYLLCQSVCN